MDRHIARTIAGDARVIWSIFSGYHPQELRESGDASTSQAVWRCLVRRHLKRCGGQIE